MNLVFTTLPLPATVGMEGAEEIIDVGEGVALI